MKNLRSLLAFLFIQLAQAGSAFAAQDDMTAGSLKTFSVLIGTVALLFVLAWAAKKYGPFSRVKKNLGLDILGQLPVGNRAHLALVRVGKTILLLGVTQNQVSLIKDLEGGDFEKTIDKIEAGEGVV
jgi:flagellar biosynthetic protein FliO